METYGLGFRDGMPGVGVSSTGRVSLVALREQVVPRPTSSFGGIRSSLDLELTFSLCLHLTLHSSQLPMSYFLRTPGPSRSGIPYKLA